MADLSTTAEQQGRVKTLPEKMTRDLASAADRRDHTKGLLEKVTKDPSTTVERPGSAKALTEEHGNEKSGVLAGVGVTTFITISVITIFLLYKRRMKQQYRMKRMYQLWKVNNSIYKQTTACCVDKMPWESP